MSRQAFEAWAKDKPLEVFWSYEAWQAATAATINKICADVQAAGFANGGIETPADVAPEILFQLKEKIEAATAAALAAPATAPAQPERKPMIDQTAHDMNLVAEKYAHKLALDLECVLADYSGTWYETAMKTLGDYRSAMNEIHERESPTFMGEPL